jgi:hypothetical protein
MLYQLPNGKCIELSLEQYLRMSDEELSGLIGMNIGNVINDPFAISVLKYGPARVEEEEITDDFAEEEPELLTDIDPEEKITDTDFIDDNIET